MVDYPAHHPDTASRLFDGEAVIVSPSKNMVRMLNSVGGRIWELADGSRSLAEIIEQIVQEYEVEPQEAGVSVAGFVQELVDRGMLVWMREQT